MTSLKREEKRKKDRKEQIKNQLWRYLDAHIAGVTADHFADEDRTTVNAALSEFAAVWPNITTFDGTFLRLRNIAPGSEPS